MRGVFPIGFTPITEADKLDLDCLAAEVKFCNRGRVHGFIWPQIASRWTTLTERERLDGAEAILAAGKGGRTALVIGVQGPDLAAVTRYAKHAEKLGADAIVSLPPANVNDDKALLEYYQQVGRMTELPLFAQSQRNMSVDLIVEMYKTIPTMRQLKDEAGNPLQRIGEFRKRTGDQLKVFSGMGVLTMITEMELGFIWPLSLHLFGRRLRGRFRPLACRQAQGGVRYVREDSGLLELGWKPGVHHGRARNLQGDHAVPRRAGGRRRGSARRCGRTGGGRAAGSASRKARRLSATA